MATEPSTVPSEKCTEPLEKGENSPQSAAEGDALHLYLVEALIHNKMHCKWELTES